MRFPHMRAWGSALVSAALLITALGAIDRAHAETVRASFYGAESGRTNADGSRFDPMGFTAASRHLPFGTRLEVCLARCATVTVRDRGPYVAGRSLDLAQGAARAIGLEAMGVANISVRIVGRSAPKPGSRRTRSHHRHDRHRRRP